MWIVPEVFKRPWGAKEQVDQEIHQVFVGDNNPVETVPKDWSLWAASVGWFHLVSFSIFTSHYLKKSL